MRRRPKHDFQTSATTAGYIKHKCDNPALPVAVVVAAGSKQPRAPAHSAAAPALGLVAVANGEQ